MEESVIDNELPTLTESAQTEEEAISAESAQDDISRTDGDGDEAGVRGDDYYTSLVAEDLKTLKESFSELKDIKDIGELENPMRFAMLRDLGLSAVEAYIESSKRRKYQDNRSHLYSSMPLGRSRDGLSMSRAELEMARELFPDISDSEIQKLYKTVTR